MTDYPDWVKKPSEEKSKHIVTYGKEVIKKLDEDIRDCDLMGNMDKIASQTLRKKPQAETITVVYRGKEMKYYAPDIEEMMNLSGLDLQRNKTKKVS